MRRPVVETVARHRMDDTRQASVGLLDAPTVAIGRTPAPATSDGFLRPSEGGVFAERVPMISPAGSEESLQERWQRLPNRTRVNVVFGAALAMTIGAIGLAQAPASSSTSSSTSAAPTPSTTPLGCDVHPIDLGNGHSATGTDDPLCTQKELADRLCGLTLGDSPQEYVSGGQSIQNWTGSGGQAYLSGAGRGWVFHCTDYRTEAHTLSLDDEQWSYLIRPGSPGPTLNAMLADA
jgi:hypothetical protein